MLILHTTNQLASWAVEVRNKKYYVFNFTRENHFTLTNCSSQQFHAPVILQFTLNTTIIQLQQIQERRCYLCILTAPKSQVITVRFLSFLILVITIIETAQKYLIVVTQAIHSLNGYVFDLRPSTIVLEILSPEYWSPT